MIWMLDTNMLVHLINRRPRCERIARRMSGRSPGELVMSAITLSELRFGIARSERSGENSAVLEDLLETIGAEAYPSGAARDFGDIKVELARKGKPIGPYDMLIAAHARHIGAVLVTNSESEFRRVPRLGVQNWLKS